MKVHQAVTVPVRRAEKEDIPQIVAIHQEAFRSSFLTGLGERFLSHYYGLVHEYSGGILLVRQGEASIEGFVAGFLNPAGFYRRMRREAMGLAIPVLSAVGRQPGLLCRVIYNWHRVGRFSPSRSATCCELSSIAVSPNRFGKGIGKSLATAFLDEAWMIGAHYVYLTTDADHNEFANEFYLGLGFERRRCFEQYRGRRMNEYAVCRP